MRETILSQLKKLLTANLIVRLANFTFWKVSTSKEKKEAKEFISGESLYPPQEQKALRTTGRTHGFAASKFTISRSFSLALILHSPRLSHVSR